MSTEKMREVVILQGTSGSGKSRHAKALQLYFNGRCEIVSADDWFYNSNGEYNFQPSQLGNAHGECFAKFLDRLHDASVGCVIVDNTNTSALEISPYMLAAQAHNMRHIHQVAVRIVRVQEDDLELCASRNKHGVPLKSIEGQYARIKAFDTKEGNPLGWAVTLAEKD